MGNTQGSSFGKKPVKRGYKFIKIVSSKRVSKKYDAIFEHIQTKKIKRVSFGSKGMSDYTKHRDKQRKERYLKRHRKNENWNNLMTPGALSRWILWNKPTLKGSITDYKRKFKNKYNN